MSPPDSDGQLRVVLQIWSESSQVRKEAWRAVCGATEVSRICAEHTLAMELLASQGKSLSGITEVYHRVSTDEVAAKLPRGNRCDRAWLAELR